MSNSPESSLIDDMLGSLTKINASNTVKPLKKETTYKELNQLIRDTSYGLLSKEELTMEDVALLTALLQTMRNTNNRR